MLQGLWLTILLAAVVVPLALSAGLAIAIAFSFHRRALNILLLIYIDFFRSFRCSCCSCWCISACRFWV
ncbi:MAG: hypothetical protein WDO24_13390 [Pseudomonadota bacterium]